MISIEVHRAQSRLSASVKAVETGREPEVILLRGGKPVARISSVVETGQTQRF